MAHILAVFVVLHHGAAGGCCACQYQNETALAAGQSNNWGPAVGMAQPLPLARCIEVELLVYLRTPFSANKSGMM